ncbi:MAG: hypothetical protein IKF71_03765 [Bacilli bacterium]|nr:hypothetical protein [Bacilli bacterium]
MKKSNLFTVIFVLVVVLAIAIPLLLNRKAKEDEGHVIEGRVEDVDVITHFDSSMVGKIYRMGTKIEDYSKNIRYLPQIGYPYDELFDEPVTYAQVLPVPSPSPSEPSYYDEEYYLQNRIQMEFSSEGNDRELYLGQYDCQEAGVSAIEEGVEFPATCYDSPRYYFSEQYWDLIYWKVSSVTEDTVEFVPEMATKDYFQWFQTGGGGSANYVLEKGMFIRRLHPDYGSNCKTRHIEYYDRNGNKLGEFYEDYYGVAMPGYTTSDFIGLDYDIERWDASCPILDDYHWNTSNLNCGCILTESRKVKVTLNNNSSFGFVTVKTEDDVNLVREPYLDSGGDTINVHVNPKKDNYRVVVEIVDGSGNSVEFEQDGNDYSFVMPNKDVTINVSYYSLYKITVNTPTGTESWDINIDDLNAVLAGESVVYTVTPKYGYELVSVNVVGNNSAVSVTKTGDNEYSFTMPYKDVTITPVFAKVKNSVTIVENEHTEDYDINVSDMSAVEYGKSVVVSITPKEGYELVGLVIQDEDDGTVSYQNTNNPNEVRFTMPAKDVIITPSYEKVKNSVTIVENDHTEDYDVNVDNMSAVEYDKTVIVSLTPEEGYELVGLTIEDEEGGPVPYQNTDNPNEVQFTMPDKDVVITPTYQLISNDPTPDDPTPDDPTPDDPSGGEVSPSIEPSPSPEEENIDAVPDTAEFKTRILQLVGFVLILINVVYVGTFFRKKYFRRKYR